MKIQALSLLQFKNIPSLQLRFQSRVIGLTGNNGIGKTTVLDGIHYLSLGRSFLGSSDLQNIQHKESFFVLQAQVEEENGQATELYCALKKGNKKQFKKNKKTYLKLSEHVGYLPLVIIAPQDITLIWESGENRRKWLDTFLAQADSAYLQALIHYNHLLKQRNAYIKSTPIQQVDEIWLSTLEDRLSHFGQQLFEKRNEGVQALQPMLSEFYQALAGKMETAALTYESDLSKCPLQEWFIKNRQRDWMLQYTGNGPHRDDLNFTLNGLSLRKMGSQGQQKSFLIALKLAQFQWMWKQLNKKPLLLLDDIFEKLDRQRIQKLLSLVSKLPFDQIFITHTDSHSLRSLLGQMDEQFELIDLQTQNHNLAQDVEAP